MRKFFIITFRINISVFYLSKHTEVFERDIQPHEMVTQKPAITSALSLKLCRKEDRRRRICIFAAVFDIVLFCV